MEGKGTINIRIRDYDERTKIDITDTGKGITKANLQHVFDPGFTTKKRGWGLGLTLAKRIIEQYHKGLLFVKHSEPGKGTTVSVLLPSADASESADVAELKLRPAASGSSTASPARAAMQP